MSFYKVYVEIINPIVCSIIGGVLTVLGVYLTIKYETKKDKDKTKFNNKPMFYRLDPMQQYDYTQAKDYLFSESKNESENRIWGVFRNTDKTYLVLNSILINNNKHYPFYGNVINKDEIFNLYIDTDEDLNNNAEIILIVENVYGDKYNYLIEYKLQENDNARIMSIREINNND